jgi:integrase
MSRRSTGGVVERQMARGTTFAIRFRALGARQYVTLGTDRDGWTRARAEAELAYTLEQVRRGEWAPPVEHEAEAMTVVPTFLEFASGWLHDREHELRATTLAAYRWELTDHLLPFFAGKRLDAIKVEDVDAYRRRKLAEGRLSASSINKTITRLAQILEVAQEYGHVERNVAHGKRRKLRAPTPARPWLEPEQVAVLLSAAGELDAEPSRAMPVRRALLATLAWAGLRVGEACALRWRAVSFAGTPSSPWGVVRVEEGKTEASADDVDLQPELREVLVAWREVTPFKGPDELVFPTRTGHATNRHNVRQRIMLPAVARANVRLVEQGREPLLGGLSPHALRRSFASWLIADGCDVAYVQQQMRHRDPAMTIGAYTRAVRNGRAPARSRRLHAPEVTPGWAPTGTKGLEDVSEALVDRDLERQNPGASRGSKEAL